jgi:hypothetical protein
MSTRKEREKMEDNERKAGRDTRRAPVHITAASGGGGGRILFIRLTQRRVSRLTPHLEPPRFKLTVAHRECEILARG